MGVERSRSIGHGVARASMSEVGEGGEFRESDGLGRSEGVAWVGK